MRRTYNELQDRARTITVAKLNGMDKETLPRIHLEIDCSDVVKLSHLMQCLAQARCRKNQILESNSGPSKSFENHNQMQTKDNREEITPIYEKEEQRVEIQQYARRILDSTAWDLLAECLSTVSELEPPSVSLEETISSANLPGLDSHKEQEIENQNKTKESSKLAFKTTYAISPVLLQLFPFVKGYFAAICAFRLVIYIGLKGASVQCGLGVT